MRKVFEPIVERLRAFIGQRDHAALVVRCSEANSITVLKLLEELDDTSSAELFWVCPNDFRDSASFVDAIVKDFLLKHDAMRLVMEKKAMKVWPPAPPSLSAGSISPTERLRQLMIFSRSLLPEPEGCSAVWVIFPLHVLDAAAYARLMLDLLQHRYPFPWCHHIRMILRDDEAQPGLSPALARTPSIDYYAPDLSNEAIDKAIEEEASDNSLPLADRIQAMFLSAQRDFSFGLFDQAMKKHEISLRYHIAMGNVPMVALGLNSVGEIHQRLGRTEQSGRCFEAALEPACAGENPPLPILLNTLLNLANLRMEEQRFAEAEAYYDAGEKLATVLRNPVTKLQTIENLGYCQLMQNKPADAAKTWEHGAMIAGNLEYPEIQRGLLFRVRDYYAGVNLGEKVQKVEAEIAAIQPREPS